MDPEQLGGPIENGHCPAIRDFFEKVRNLLAFPTESLNCLEIFVETSWAAISLEGKKWPFVTVPDVTDRERRCQIVAQALVKRDDYLENNMITPTRIAALFVAVACLFVCAPTQAQTTDQPSVPDSAQQQAEANASPHSFVVRMRNKKYLEGSPVEFGFIDVYILDTKVSVPLDRIKGVLISAQPDEMSTLAMTDGQLLSGQIALPELRLMVDWGDATIKRDMVRSMVRSDDLVWQESNTPNGKKWFLTSRSGQNTNSGIYTGARR